MTETIAVIEDDRQIRAVLQGYLERAGYRVLTASDGPAGLTLVHHAKPALLILDLMLPELDGLEITRQIRASTNPQLANLYIIMLTARVEEADRVIGLELGADDYVTKPFSPRELVARIRAALRRIKDSHPHSTDMNLDVDGLHLDPALRRVTLNGQTIDLTTAEFDLLHHFMLHPARPFTRSELLDVTQPDTSGDTTAYERTIDVHIKNLRQKLGDSGRHSRFIETVQRVGYRFIYSDTDRTDTNRAAR